LPNPEGILERISNTELHPSRIALNAVEDFSKSWRGSCGLGVLRQTVRSLGEIPGRKVLLVQHVKDLPTKLQLVILAPGHVKAF